MANLKGESMPVQTRSILLIALVILIVVIGVSYVLMQPQVTPTPTGVTRNETTPAPPKEEYKRTLVIAVDLDNQALDVQQAEWTTLANWYAFSSLVAFDPERRIVTDLAESYEIEEG
ncbi:MAG: hypothetical protein NZ992_06665, partial [Candidatus Korarchaeum sp.]|nr:hypothetical protein [Candidatus Korarchaeum sp.]MDW8035723.1 hypothetical protein [Candidatus Korarchaeum sp.]